MEGSGGSKGRLGKRRLLGSGHVALLQFRLSTPGADLPQGIQQMSLVVRRCMCNAPSQVSLHTRNSSNRGCIATGRGLRVIITLL